MRAIFALCTYSLTVAVASNAPAEVRHIISALMGLPFGTSLRARVCGNQGRSFHGPHAQTLRPCSLSGVDDIFIFILKVRLKVASDRFVFMYGCIPMFECCISFKTMHENFMPWRLASLVQEHRTPFSVPVKRLMSPLSNAQVPAAHSRVSILMHHSPNGCPQQASFLFFS